MGTVTVAPDFPMDDLIRKVGGDRETASYAPATQTLDVPGVSSANLARGVADINARVSAADTADKRRKEAAIRAAALRRHVDAVLAADTTYQAQLAAVAAAVTLADLDAIVP